MLFPAILLNCLDYKKEYFVSEVFLNVMDAFSYETFVTLLTSVYNRNHQQKSKKLHVYLLLDGFVFIKSL